MKKASNGDKVTVHYTVKISDDQIYETSKGRAPLQFEIGSSSVMSRLNEELQGMQVGDKKTFRVPPEEGYGERQNDLVGTVQKSDFPHHVTPAIGQQMQVKLLDGGSIDVIVTDIEDEVVTLDGNHPLAGHTLEFEVEMMDIQ
jgi:FKBP-type peptidyl-prolyl cis-trans isomerase 2